MNFLPKRAFYTSSTRWRFALFALLFKTANCYYSTAILTSNNMSSTGSAAKASNEEHYRSDGVRITHNPYAPGMLEKYGLPGNTDPEGFDPYADTVGPGIYGGSVKRNPDTGDVIIGEQYQNHNPTQGPVYDGKGYSLMSRAIHAGPEKVQQILRDFQEAELKDEVSTGGARPLHTCGMSRNGQHSTRVLLDAGADMHAVDTYGMNALHRMASNDLEVGGEALVKAGLDPNQSTKDYNRTPIEIARSSHAINFLRKMNQLGHYD
jgi:hypothetical protein